MFHKIYCVVDKSFVTYLVLIELGVGIGNALVALRSENVQLSNSSKKLPIEKIITESKYF